MSEKNKNAFVNSYKGKDNKDYLECTLYVNDKEFNFKISAKFLNKKQFAYLMRLVPHGKGE